MPSQMPHAVVLDDDEHLANLVGDLTRSAGFDTTVTTRADAFQAAVANREPRLIVLDLQMPEIDGVEALRLLAEQKCSAAILLVTGMDQRTMSAAEEYGRTRRLNLLGSLQKPFSPPEFIDKLRSFRAANDELTLTDLQAAIEQNKLVVYYQATLRRFADGSWDVGAAEALLRWDHPQRGILTPDMFLKMGEDGGLARPMADYVLQRGVEQLRIWRNHGHELGLRVNISAQLIADLDFPDRLEILLKEHNIDPSLLTLEITETSMLEQAPATIDILTRLRVKEMALAIDDFGIGYSSLTQLFRMPFNEMKIDKSLVKSMPESREAYVMVETLVELAQKLGLSACAEGVESLETLRMLDDIGCDAAQGYFVSKPVTAAELPNVLARWPRSVS
jgi:EAL domain-containing protein (putative c-di-GMP-specific phosphodiesterase class I)